MVRARHYTILKDPGCEPGTLRAWVFECVRLGYSWHEIVAADQRARQVLMFFSRMGFVERSARREPTGPMPPTVTGRASRPDRVARREELRREQAEARAAQDERERRDAEAFQAIVKLDADYFAWAERERANAARLAEQRKSWVEGLARRPRYEHRPRSTVPFGSSATAEG